MKSNRTGIIAWREWKTTVLRRNFLIATFGLPLAFLFIDGIAFAGIYFTSAKAAHQRAGDTRPVGICDPGHVLNEKAFSKPLVGVRYEIVDQQRGQSLVIANKYRALVVVPSDYVATGKISVYGKAGSGVFSDGQNAASQTYYTALKAGLIWGKVPDKVALRAARPLLQNELKIYEWNPKAADFQRPDTMKKTAGFVVPYAFSLLLFMSIIMGTGYLLQGIVEEKENRVMEVLLSSISHEELLRGKMVGLGGAGLTQMAVWMIVPGIALLFALPYLPASFRIDPSTIVIALVLFILGFAFYGTIIAGFGSLGSSPRESQQIMAFVSLFPVLPLMLMTPILESPNDILARVLSWFPPTAPIALMLRSAVEKIPLWDLALGIGLLILTIWISQKLTAKLFRLGLLLYGKSPSFTEVVRWLRAA